MTLSSVGDDKSPKKFRDQMGNDFNKTSSTLQLKSSPNYYENYILSISLTKSGNVTTLETLPSLIGYKYNPDVSEVLWQKRYSLPRSHTVKALLKYLLAESCPYKPAARGTVTTQHCVCHIQVTYGIVLLWPFLWLPVLVILYL